MKAGDAEFTRIWLTESAFIMLFAAECEIQIDHLDDAEEWIELAPQNISQLKQSPRQSDRKETEAKLRAIHTQLLAPVNEDERPKSAGPDIR